MRVMVNPHKRVDGRPLQVLDPLRLKPYPSKEFDLSETELRNPAVLRLLPPSGKPGGVSGGRDADLVPVAHLDAYGPSKPKSKNGKE